MDEIVVQGTRVIYSGSLPDYQGMKFRVTGISKPDVPPEYLHEYPGEVAYQLTSVERIGRYLENVRRTSFEIVD